MKRDDVLWFVGALAAIAYDTLFLVDVVPQSQPFAKLIGISFMVVGLIRIIIMDSDDLLRKHGSLLELPGGIAVFFVLGAFWPLVEVTRVAFKSYHHTWTTTQED